MFNSDHPFEQVQALACASFFALTSHAQTPAASVILHTGTKHFNFTDYAVTLSPLRAFGLLDSIEGARGLEITLAYVAAFFDTYLNKMPSPLLAGEAHTYPQMHSSSP